MKRWRTVVVLQFTNHRKSSSTVVIFKSSGNEPDFATQQQVTDTDAELGKVTRALRVIGSCNRNSGHNDSN